MSFRSKIYIPFASLVLFGILASCTDEENVIINNDAQEIVVSTSIYGGSTSTRAVAAVTDYVGRGIEVQNSKDKDFESGDRIRLTSIKRSGSPLESFTYTNVDFLNKAGSWDRVSSPTATPESDSNSGIDLARIYWSDANNPHTFIGYSLPFVARSSGEGNAFDDKWKQQGETYYSCIGSPTGSETIDFSSEYGSDGNETVSGNSKIKKEDLLLTYNIEQKAEPGGSVAKLIFCHALANVRVIVNIRGFAATSDAMDTRTRVSDLMLKKMPMMYKWRQQSDKAEPLIESDASAMSSFGWNKDLKKDVKTWMPHPEGVGDGVDRTFTFYALAVPGTTNLVMPFKVSYPKPLNPTDTDTKDYEAKIDKVELKAGYCTTINISLNHNDEEMTVGATYIDWEFIETPDRGALRKNSVFLENTDRSKITIVGDKLATNYDAIWLYNELDADGTPKTDANGKQIIKDIYGHTGDSEEDAYQISTAQQFLSFAYEVKGTNRGTENGSSLSGGMDFTGKYIKLDADIYLQPSRTSSTLSWEGIGDATHAFNGTFLGGGRIISRLKGKSLFASIGSNAVVEYLALRDIVDIGSSTAALTDNNRGKISACMIDSKIESTSSNPVGAVAGSNAGIIQICYHNGDIKGKGQVAGIVGTNTGNVISCYNAGAISTESTSAACYGIVAVNTGGNTISSCFYDSKLAVGINKVAPSGLNTDNPSSGKLTSEMQKLPFVSELNFAIDNTFGYSYNYAPTMYPYLGPYTQTSATSLLSGYYRVQNYGSQRYVYVMDNTGSIGNNSEDLGAIVMKKDFSNTISDPGSIIYVKSTGKQYEYNLSSQGTDVKTITKYNISLVPRDGKYLVGATNGLSAKYLADVTPDAATVNGSVATHHEDITNKNNLLWMPVSVDVKTSNYFGVTPTVTIPEVKDAEGNITTPAQYYAPFYADFGFKVLDGMEVYYVSNIVDDVVTLKKLTGVVPNKTPVIIKCKSANVADNKLDLKYYVSSVSGNELKGNMFNNPGIVVGGETKHTNQTTTTENMRVLAVDDGNLVFKKPAVDAENPRYLPANSSYLIVADGTAEELSVIFE